MPRNPERAAMLSRVAVLYGAQLSLYVVPLVQIPYLVRVLGPEAWGGIAFAQGFAAYLLVISDYGMGLFGTRAIARAAGDRAEERRVASGVVSAKLWLNAICLAIATVVWRFVPAFVDDPLVLWLAVAVALGMAWSWGWFFLGIERPQVISIADTAVRLLGLGVLFVVVRQPDHAWRVLAISLATVLIVNTFGLILMARRCGFPVPTLAAGLATLRAGWYLFLFRGGVGLYSAGNAFVLGLLASPVAVGYFVGAERIVRACVGLIDPVAAVLFPRISRLVVTAADGGRSMLRLTVGLMGGLGVAIGIGVLLLAPVFVSVLLGPAFEPAVKTLRILAALPVLVALSNALGMQWMIPNGLERPFAVIAYGAGALNIGLAVALTPLLEHNGMAIAWVGAEAMVTLGCLIVVRRHLRLNPSANAPAITVSPHTQR